MDRQGAQRTYNIPKEYNNQFDMVLNSPASVVWIMDVDSTKISIGIKHTTLSGKNWTLVAKQCGNKMPHIWEWVKHSVIV